MNINIAFNTIIYIMVFLFPGILFRRAFFSGKFNKHFDSGNTFERLLWALLCSIISIALFSCVLIFIDSYTDGSVEDFIEIGYCEVIDNFRAIYSNNFPSIFDSTRSLLKLSGLLFTLYIFSSISGFLLHKFIFILGLEKRFSLFKFQNAWDYLTNSNKQNNGSHKLGDIYYTRVDIKTSEGELFTGKLHDIVLDKEGKIDAIAIQETYKFYTLEKTADVTKINHVKSLIRKKDINFIFHSETVTEYIYKKRIKGNVFTAFNDKISNISITYVKLSHIYERFRKYLRYFTTVLLTGVILFSISYSLWDYHLLNFTNSFRRIGFCIMLPFNVMTFLLFFISIINIKKKKYYWDDIIYCLLITVLFTIPHLYIAGYSTFLFMILYVAIFMIIFTIIISLMPKRATDIQ